MDYHCPLLDQIIDMQRSKPFKKPQEHHHLKAIANKPIPCF